MRTPKHLRDERTPALASRDLHFSFSLSLRGRDVPSAFAADPGMAGNKNGVLIAASACETCTGNVKPSSMLVMKAKHANKAVSSGGSPPGRGNHPNRELETLPLSRCV